MSLIQYNNNYNWCYPEVQGQTCENNPYNNNNIIPSSGISQLEVNHGNDNNNELTKKLVVSCDDMNVVESSKSSQREEESDFGLKTLRSAQMNWGELKKKDETIHCWDCTYSTTNPISMNRHKLIHLYKTRFECSHCNHTFGEEIIFELHVKTHIQKKQRRDEKSTSSSASSSSSSSASTSSSSLSLSQKNKKLKSSSSSASTSKMPILTDSLEEGKKNKKTEVKNKNKNKGKIVKTGIRKKSSKSTNNLESIITVDLADDDDGVGEKDQVEKDFEDEEKRREREEIEEILHIFDDDSDYDSGAERKKKKKKKKVMRQINKSHRPLSLKKKRTSTKNTSTSINDKHNNNDGNQNQDNSNNNDDPNNGNSSSGEEKPLELVTTPLVKGKKWKVKLNVQFKFKCTFPGCNYGCHSTSRFKDHLINHSDQKNFKCHLCESSFKRKYGLERHQMTVHYLSPQSK